MASNHGQLNRDLIGGSLQIKSKRVIDKDCNAVLNSLKVKDCINTDCLNSRTGTLTVKSDVCLESGLVLKTDCIDTNSSTLVVKSDVCLESGQVLQIDCVESKSGSGLQVKDDLCLDSGYVLKIGSNQVVSGQYGPIPNAYGSLGEVTTRVNQILNALRSHGLIAP